MADNDIQDFQDDMFSEFDIDVPGANTPANKVAGTVKAVAGSVKAVGSGAMSGISKELQRKFPTTTGVVSEAMQLTSGIREITRDISKEMGTAVNAIKGATLKTMPLVKKVVPQKIYESVQQKLKDSYIEPDESTPEQREEAARNASITNALNEIFSGQMAAQKETADHQEASRAVDRQIATVRFKTEQKAIGGLHSQLASVNTFLSTTFSAYMKKSLEIKYKHMYIARDTFAMLRSLTKITEARLLEIKHNTALPDHVKTVKGKKSDTWKNRMGSSLSSHLSNFTSNLLKNIKEATLDKIQMAVGTGMLGLEAVGGMADPTMMEHMAVTPMQIINQILGYVSSHVAGKLTNKYLGKKADSVADFEKMATTVPSNIKLAAQRWAEKHRGTGGIMGILADLIPHYSTTANIGNTMLSASDEAVAFDYITRQTIVEIIPTHLERMGMYLEGIAKNIFPTKDYSQYMKVFNPAKRELTSAADMLSDMRQSISSSDRTISYSMDKVLGTMKGSLDSKELTVESTAFVNDYQELFRLFLSNSATLGKPLNPEALLEYVTLYAENSLADLSDESRDYTNAVFSGFKTSDEKIQVAQLLISMLYINGQRDTSAILNISNAINSLIDIDVRNWIPKVAEHFGLRRHLQSGNIVGYNNTIKSDTLRDIVATTYDKKTSPEDIARISQWESDEQKASRDRFIAEQAAREEAGITDRHGGLVDILNKLNLDSALSFIPKGVLKFIDPILIRASKIKDYIKKSTDELSAVLPESIRETVTGVTGEEIERSKTGKYKYELVRIEIESDTSCYLIVQNATSTATAQTFKMRYSGYKPPVEKEGKRVDRRPPKPRGHEFKDVDLTKWKSVPLVEFERIEDTQKEIPEPVQKVQKKITPIPIQIPPASTVAEAVPEAKQVGPVHTRLQEQTAPKGARLSISKTVEKAIVKTIPGKLETIISVLKVFGKKSEYTTLAVDMEPKGEQKGLITQLKESEAAQLVKKTYEDVKGSKLGQQVIVKAQKVKKILSNKQEFLAIVPEKYRDQVSKLLDQVNDSPKTISAYYDNLKAKYKNNKTIHDKIAEAKQIAANIKDPEKRKQYVRDSTTAILKLIDDVKHTQPKSVWQRFSGSVKSKYRAVKDYMGLSVGPPPLPGSSPVEDAAKESGKEVHDLSDSVSGTILPDDQPMTVVQEAMPKAITFEGEPESLFHSDFRQFAIRQLQASERLSSKKGIFGMLGGALRRLGSGISGLAGMYGNILSGIVKGAGSIIGGIAESGIPGALIKGAGSIIGGGLSLGGGIAKGIYHGAGSIIGSGLSLGGGIAKRIYHGAGALLGGAFKRAGSLYKGTMSALFGKGEAKEIKDTSPPAFVDIYLKDNIDPGKPLLSAKRQMLGIYTVEGNKEITHSADITEPVFGYLDDTEKDVGVLITKENIEHGLVDVNNKPITKVATSAGSKTKTGNFIKSIFGSGILGNIFSAAGSVIKGAGSLYGSIFATLGKGIKATARIGSTMLGRLFGIDTEGNQKFHDDVVTRLDKIINYMSHKHEASEEDAKEDKIFGDSAEEQLQKAEQKQEKLKAKQAENADLRARMQENVRRRKEAAGSKDTGSVIGNVKQAGTDLWDKGVHLFDTVSNFFGGKKGAAKTAGKAARSAGRLGKLGRSLKLAGRSARAGNFARSAKLLGTLGKTGKAARTAKILGSAAKVGKLASLFGGKAALAGSAGSAAAGTAAAGGAAAGGAGLLGSAGAMLTNPVTAGILGALAIGYGGYKGVKGFSNENTVKNLGLKEGTKADFMQRLSSALGSGLTFGLAPSMGSKAINKTMEFTSKINPLYGLIRGIQGDKRPMSSEEISSARKKLQSKIEKDEPGAKNIYERFENAILAQEWPTARALSDSHTDGIIKSIYKHSLTEKLATNYVKAMKFIWLGNNDKPMTAEEIEKFRKNMQSRINRGQSDAKNILEQFEEAVLAQEWPKARKLAKVEKDGLLNIFRKPATTRFGAFVKGGGLGLLLFNNKRAPMSDKEIRDHRTRLQKLIADGNTSAQKILEEFEQAVVEENWFKARRLTSEETNSLLTRLIKNTYKGAKFYYTLGMLGDNERPMSEKEIIDYRRKMEYIASQGDLQAKKKLELFDNAVAKDNWVMARKIAKAPHKTFIRKGVEGIIGFYFGDDDKPMTAEEIEKFRKNMNHKIQIGENSANARRKLDAFEDAIMRQNWKKARIISNTKDIGLYKKVTTAYMKGLFSIYGSDSTEMKATEIDEFRTKMNIAIEKGDKIARKKLNMFDSAVMDENWRMARKIADMPHKNIYTRTAKRLLDLFRTKKVSDNVRDSIPFKRWKLLIENITKSMKKISAFRHPVKWTQLALLKRRVMFADAANLDMDYINMWDMELHDIDAEASSLEEKDIKQEESIEQKKDNTNISKIVSFATTGKYPGVDINRYQTIRSYVDAIVNSEQVQKLDPHVQSGIRNNIKLQFSKFGNENSSVSYDKWKKSISGENDPYTGKKAVDTAIKAVYDKSTAVSKHEASEAKKAEKQKTSDNIKKNAKTKAEEITPPAVQKTKKDTSVDMTKQPAASTEKKASAESKKTDAPAKLKSMWSDTLGGTVKTQGLTEVLNDSSASATEAASNIKGDVDDPKQLKQIQKQLSGEISGTKPDMGQMQSGAAKQFFANLIKNNKNETSVTLDKLGNVIGMSTGTRTKVNALMSPGSTVIHNHPDGSYISETDIRSAAKYGVDSVVTAAPSNENQQVLLSINQEQLRALQQIVSLLTSQLDVTKESISDVNSKIVAAADSTIKAAVSYTDKLTANLLPPKQLYKPAPITVQKTAVRT